jgi:hypothetical protein
MLDEQYAPRRECSIVEVGRASEVGALKSDEQGQEQRPVIKQVYRAPDCFYLAGFYDKYSLDLPPFDDCDEYSKMRPLFDLYGLRDYLNELIQQDEADYKALIDDEPEHIDLEGNVFNMRAEDLPFEQRQYIPIRMEKRKR